MIEVWPMSKGLLVRRKRFDQRMAKRIWEGEAPAEPRRKAFDHG
jgi:hypothetical protein